jgi:hypothetical protein
VKDRGIVPQGKGTQCIPQEKHENTSDSPSMDRDCRQPCRLGHGIPEIRGALSLCRATEMALRRAMDAVVETRDAPALSAHGPRGHNGAPFWPLPPARSGLRDVIGCARTSCFRQTCAGGPRHMRCERGGKGI